MNPALAAEAETESPNARSARRSDFAARLHGQQLLGLWERNREGGTRPERPFHWRADILRELLHESGSLISIDEGEGRRVLQLIGPGLDSTTGLLQMSLQLIKPGEIAVAHRHAISAIRFVVSGQGAYTTIAGAKFPLQPGDLLVTPPRAWHDHGNEGSQDVVWVDVLDSAFVQYAKTVLFEPYEQPRQTAARPAALYSSRFALSGDAQRPISEQPIRYSWKDSWAQLQELMQQSPDPYDGALLHYRHPLVGDATTYTVACRLQALASSQETATHRHTSAASYYVVRGRGVTRVDGCEIEWGEGDCFVVPSWTWHSHRKVGAEPSILFVADEQPLLQRLHLYVEEPAPGGKVNNGHPIPPTCQLPG